MKPRRLPVLFPALLHGLITCAALSPAVDAARPAPQESERSSAPADALRAEFARLDAELRLKGSAVARELSFRNAVEGLWNATYLEVPFEGQAALLREVVLLRSKVLALAGDASGALSALDEHAMELHHLKGDPEVTKRINANVLAMAATVAADPLIVAARLALQREASEASATLEPTQNAGDLERTVRTAIYEQNWQLVYDLGPRSAPFLVEAALADAEMPQDVRNDPLFTLIRLDSELAGRLLLERADQGGYLWRRRILRAMEASSVLENAELWVPFANAALSLVCAQPAWIELVERLIADPESRPAAMAFVRTLAERNALSPKLAEILAALVREDPARNAATVSQVLPPDGYLSSAEPVLAALLDVGESTLRRQAAKSLSYLPRPESLLARARDEDASIRSAALASRQNRTVQLQGWFRGQATWPDSGSAYRQEYQWNVTMNSDPKDESIVMSALGDAFSDSRIAALSIAAERKWLDVEGLRIYLDGASERVLTYLLDGNRFPSLPMAVQVEALTRLADNQDVDIRKEVDAALARLAEVDPVRAEGPFQARVRASAGPGALDPRVLLSLVKTDEGRRIAARGALLSGTPDMVRALWDALRSRPSDDRLSLLALDDESLRALYLLGDANLESNNTVLLELLTTTAADRLDLLESLAMAPLRVPSDRFALALAVTTRAPERGVALCDRLAHEIEAGAWRRSDVQELFEALLPAERNQLLTRLVADPSASRPVLFNALGTLDVDAPGGHVLLANVLDRWLPEADQGASFLARFAVSKLPRAPEVATFARLELALSFDKTSVVAVDAMRRLRNPAFIPLLGRALNATWIEDENESSQLGMQAANALAGFFSEDAAAELLKGLRSIHGNVRAAAGEGLDTIQATLDREAAWALRDQQAPTQESALAELLQLLESGSPAVRAEAARGLGTLGAVELVPRLIGLLEDPDPRVVQAARDALDRLNK